MRKSWLVCALLGTLAWGQAAPGTPPPGQAAPTPGRMAPQAAAPDTSASVPADAPVITVNGVCSPQPKPAAAKTAAAAAKPVAKAPAADCKTVITKAEFEKLAAGIAPTVTPQLKRQLASVLPRFIAMSAEAKKRGLDKTPRFEETVKFAKMQILTQELQRSIQEQAAKISDADLEKHYKDNPEAFEQYNLDRLFVPRTKQNDEAEKDESEKDEKDQKLTEEQQKAKEAEEKTKTEAAEQEMTKLAESLHTRAAAGEDFPKLQKEAFEAAGMKIDSPTVNLPTVRRTGLPPGHAAIFELKAGQVSEVINDSGGHYIYKVNSKQVLPFDQVKTEIHSTLQNQRTREMMDKVNNSFKSETNEAYFGPGGPQMQPPPHLPNPRLAPAPTSPQAKPQAAPPAQAPAEKPN
ncbi:MAG TPA: peptidyl-prolyl cis-trans isomerase [Candidatus Solibacter sp.]|nr:peptidyl-prolyl cis-trans isomerase [Candidatus Solibacter sp.]